jgi:hypothetical protein
MKKYFDFAIYGSDYKFVTKEVPFFAIVLGGNIPLYSEYVNFKADTTEYKLTISPLENPSADSLRFISQLLMCNYLKAKEKLHSEIMLTNNAVKVKEIAVELTKHKIKFTITPDFPYSI